MAEAFPRSSVLLLGGSGFFGPSLASAFGPGATLATYASNPIPGGIALDVRAGRVAALLQRLEVRPSAAIILFGITGIDDCARDPAGTREVNVDGVIRAIEDLRAAGVVPVFASSDAVFSGARAFWRETDEVSPILTYGKQKLAVERYLLGLPPPWLVVRLPKLIASGGHPRCMVTGWVHALGRPGRILCATDQYFTPLAADAAAAAIAALIAAGALGLYHVAGPERLSRIELLERVMEVYRSHASVSAEIVRCSLPNLPFLEPRPLDTSMCSAKLQERVAVEIRDMATTVRAAVAAHFASAGA